MGRWRQDHSPELAPRHALSACSQHHLPCSVTLLSPTAELTLRGHYRDVTTVAMAVLTGLI